MTSPRGASAVELAVSIPVLVVILVGAIDFGRVFYTAMGLTNAARAGAQYGSQNNVKSTDTAGMQSTAQTSAQNDLGTITAAASQTCGCVPNSPANENYAVSAPTPNTCLGTCSSGHLVVFVTVTASKVLSTLALYPGIPRTLTINRASRVRVQ